MLIYVSWLKSSRKINVNMCCLQQLAKISEQLAIKNRRNKRIWKIVGFTLLGIIIVNIILVLLNVAAFNNYTHFKNATVVEESI